MANYRTSAAGGGSSGTSNRTVAITAAIGDLIVCFVVVGGNTQNAPTMSDGGAGGTYTRIRTENYQSTVPDDYRLSVFVRDNLVTAAGSITITATTGSNTAGELVAVAVAGMSKAGASAVLQHNGQSAQAATTPAPAFSASCKTYNMTIVAAANSSASPILTNPTGWTERQDAGQTSPTTSIEVCTRDSGFTGTTVTWGSASGTQFADIILELDASPFSHIQGAAGSASSVATVNATLGTTPVAGNVILSGIALATNVTAVTCKDSNNNTYTVVGPVTNGAGIQAYLAYLLNAPANATATITWAWTTNSNVAVFADEFNPCGGTAVFDNSQTGTGASGTTINTPSITPANANSLLWAVAASGATISAPVGGAVGTATKLGSWWGSGGAITTGDAAEYALGLSASTAVQFTQSSAAWGCIAASIVWATNVTVNVTGPGMTSTAGSTTEQAGASVSAAGSAGTLSTGTPTVQAGASVSPTGQALTASTGSPTLTGTANVSPSGNAITSSAGNPTVQAGASVAVTGSGLASATGTPTIQIGAVANATGNALAASPGNVTLSGDANVVVTGNGITASPGTLAVAADANVSVSGSALAAATGTPTEEAGATVSPVGSQVSSTAGDVTVDTSSGVNVTVAVGGQQIDASAGTVTIVIASPDVTVHVTGCAMQASAGSPTIGIGLSTLPIIMSPIPPQIAVLPQSQWPFRFYETAAEYKTPYQEAAEWYLYSWRKRP